MGTIVGVTYPARAVRKEDKPKTAKKAEEPQAPEPAEAEEPKPAPKTAKKAEDVGA